MVSEALSQALALIFSLDKKLAHTVGLSLFVSGTATLIGGALGVAFGSALAVMRFRGRRIVVACLNAAMGLPPVVVGLVVYLLLSRAGPLGPLGILFTPTAMVIAQVLLVAPLMAALARQSVEDAYSEYHEQLTVLRTPRVLAVRALVWDTRFSLLTVLLAGFGRAMAEVGAVMIVGGNIDGVTRTMTTTIALETSKGDLAMALALGLVLMALVLAVNALAAWVKDWAAAHHG
jgi:tungstate transport system permease protein